MTSDEPALIDAILANRDDDTRRLIYADWLEENAGTVPCPSCEIVEASGYAHNDFLSHASGECYRCGTPVPGTGRISDGRRERGEFIRVQVKLARNHPAHHTAETGCPLRRRERELLSDENKAAWFGSTYFNRISASYSRGFVSALTCPWSDWSQHAAAILRTQPIERVKLTTYPEVMYNPASGAHHFKGMAFHYLPRGEQHDHSRSGIARMLLASDWPRIEFELPPEQNNSATWQFNLDLVAAENR